MSFFRRFHTTLPRDDRSRYPFDLDPSLRYTRRTGDVDYFPNIGGDGVHPKIFALQGLAHMWDGFLLSQAVGKTPYGPDINYIPINYAWQVIVPGLSKVG